MKSVKGFDSSLHFHVTGCGTFPPTCCVTRQCALFTFYKEQHYAGLTLSSPSRKQGERDIRESGS